MVHVAKGGAGRAQTCNSAAVGMMKLSMAGGVSGQRKAIRKGLLLKWTHCMQEQVWGAGRGHCLWTGWAWSGFLSSWAWLHCSVSTAWQTPDSTPQRAGAWGVCNEGNQSFKQFCTAPIWS